MEVFRTLPYYTFFAWYSFSLQQSIISARPTAAPVDLSYDFGESTVYWPATPDNVTFDLHSLPGGSGENGGIFFRWHWFITAEHGGTHIDAPSHFNKNGKDVSQLAPAALTGPAIVIDVKDKVKSNPDYAVTLRDVQNWEKQCGRVPRGAFVLMNSNWGTRWPDVKRIFQSSNPKNISSIHFPSFGHEAVEYLIRTYRIKGVGVDTPSVDIGQSKDYKVHQALAREQLVGIENVANVNKLQPCSNYIVIAPIKLVGGSGVPSRIFGWPGGASPFS